jgi:MinD superfamily P-loop ATPase
VGVIVAVVSGKGGTGKTTLAASLARAWARESPVLLADCDVEGPNAHHFLDDLGDLCDTPVTIPVPVVDQDACDHRGACADACAFNALAVLPDRTLFFESLCHACGGCVLACPRDAIRESRRQVGNVRSGDAGHLRFVQGVLSVGESLAMPVVEAVLERSRAESSSTGDAILDGPPGASCPVARVVRAADVCLLVTEPTPFGLHDLTQAHELITLRKKPAAVILNRARGNEQDRKVEAWCRDRRIPLLLSIPDRRSIAEAYARGVPLLGALPEIGGFLARLRNPLRHLAEGGKNGVAA